MADPARQRVVVLARRAGIGIKTAGGTDRFLNGLNRVNKSKVSVGIVEKQLHRNGSSVIDMAWLYHHLDQGPVGKKRKSWPTLARGVTEANTEPRVKQVIRDAQLGNGAAGLHKLGSTIALKVKSNIQAIKSPALERETIKAKGSSNPLIDSGDLKKAIDYRIRPR